MSIIRAYDKSGNIQFSQNSAAILAGPIDYIGQNTFIQGGTNALSYYSFEKGVYSLNKTYSLNVTTGVLTGCCMNRGVGFDNLQAWEGVDGNHVVSTITEVIGGVASRGWAILNTIGEQQKFHLLFSGINANTLVGCCTNGSHYFYINSLAGIPVTTTLRQFEITGANALLNKTWTLANPFFDCCYDGEKVWGVRPTRLQQFTLDNNSTAAGIDKTIAISGATTFGVTFDGNWFWVVSDT